MPDQLRIDKLNGWVNALNYSPSLIKGNTTATKNQIDALIDMILLTEKCVNFSEEESKWAASHLIGIATSYIN